jgi:hypothetical protein
MGRSNHTGLFRVRCEMANAKELAERARMFEERAEKATDPISRQHYREMAAHYRSLSVEHHDVVDHQTTN